MEWPKTFNELAGIKKSHYNNISVPEHRQIFFKSFNDFYLGNFVSLELVLNFKTKI